MQSICLNGTWQFKSEEDTAWGEAQVPGDVHLDLLKNEVIQHPLYADNAKRCTWIEENLDAKIFLNETYLKEHRNAFIPCVIDITNYIKEGDNQLVVKLDPGKKRVEKKSIREYHLDDYMDGRNESSRRIWMRKPQFVFGWDWAPYLPTCGIWRDVELISYEKVAIRDVCLRSHIEENAAVVNVEVETKNFASHPLEVNLSLSLQGEREYSLNERVTLNPGSNINFYKIEIPDAKFWYPQPIGEPYLYIFTLTISENTKKLTSYSTKYGIREIELIQEPVEDGRSFIISVNKKKIFCKGANWAPADSIPVNVSKQKYKKLIELASKANFNMFRVNGVGIYEDPLFYQLCDEYGIMIWQDFTFACAPYPDDDSEFMLEVRKEVEVIVKELRNHPCVVLWCGNNENQVAHYIGYWGGKNVPLRGMIIYDKLLPEVCEKLDPTRPYWPSSPYGGENPGSEEEGDTHTGPPDGINYKDYALSRGKFITEFYYLAPSVKESLLEFIPRKELYIDSPSWKYHNNTLEKGKIKAALKRFFIPQEKLSLEEYIISSQMIQAEALKFAAEHWRRRMFNTAGALFWAYNDCWGTTTGWTIVDYYLRLKPGYFYVKKAFEPVHVSLKETSPIEVWITNDTYTTYPVTVEYGIKTFDGKDLLKERKQEKLPIGEAYITGKIDTADIPEEQKSKVFCYAKLYSDNKLISQNRCFLVNFKDLNLPEADIERKLTKDNSEYRLTLSSKNFAWMVNVKLSPRASLADNYFDIFPDEDCEIIITTSKSLHIDDINISTMNQILRKYVL